MLNETATLTLIGGAGATLAAAITALWKSQVSQHEKLEKKLDDCHRKHEESRDKEIELVQKNAALEQKIIAVEARVDGYLEAKTDLQQLSDKVITILESKVD